MEVTKPRSRLPGWGIGVFLGDTFWLIAFTFYLAAQSDWLPRSLMRLEAVQTLDAVCGLFALPIAVGGWFYIWGDNGPPYKWMDSAVLNIAFGLAFYALYGGLIGHIATRTRSRRFSLRTMLILMTLFALFLGCVTALVSYIRNPPT